jgi:hypothetical protein
MYAQTEENGLATASSWENELRVNPGVNEFRASVAGMQPPVIFTIMGVSEVVP